MKFLHKASLFLIRCLTVFSLLCYSASFISPSDFWPAGFLTLVIPVLLVVNFGLLFFYALKRSNRIAYPLIALLTGFKFIMSTFSWNFKPAEDKSLPKLKVLTYNVRVFNVYDHLKNKEYRSSKAMLKWSVEPEEDIKCFQEFYNEKNDKVFNSVQKLKQGGKYQAYVKPSVTNKIGAQFGLAIFSRFPIIKKGVVEFENKTFNQAIYADLLFGKDTLRVYNIHLESMHIDADKVTSSKQLKSEYKLLFNRLKNGFVARGRQIETLLKHIKKSPYKVVLCGDFNDLPYSYPYNALNKHLKNAFEEGGKGFGFSYNGKLFFLRIDQQFFSKGLQIMDFKTCYEAAFSDHFPLVSEYALLK